MPQSQRVFGTRHSASSLVCSVVGSVSACDTQIQRQMRRMHVGECTLYVCVFGMLLFWRTLKISLAIPFAIHTQFSHATLEIMIYGDVNFIR